MSTNRIEKVNSLLEREISKILQRDFEFENTLVTLTRVEATANLIDAKVYISVLPIKSSRSEGGPDSQIDRVVNVLNKKAGDIQFQINRLLKMRPIPKIVFVKDEHLKEAGKVEELLYKISKEDKGKGE